VKKVAKVEEAMEEIKESEEIDEEDDEEEVKSKKRKSPAKAKEPAAKKAKGKGKAKKGDDEDGEEEGGQASTDSKSVTPSQTDFTVPKKNPDQLKIVSWNVAGFKAVLGKGFVDYLTAEDPDVICLQETKMAEEVALKQKLPSTYHAYFSQCEHNKGYSGTGLLTKEKPISVTKGLGVPEHDTEGRAITAEFDKFYIVTSYVPNSGRKLDRLPYRIENWDKDLLKYLKSLEEKKPVIWCGDLNVAHKEIDLKNPGSNKRTAGFTKEERDSFTKILESGFVDSFRHFYPDLKGAYTYWSFFKGARQKDVGWRLDYFVVSKDFMGSIVDSVIRKHVLGSDHCPLLIIVNK